MAAIDSEKMVFCTIMYHNVGVLDIIIIDISIANRYSYNDNYDKNIILAQSLQQFMLHFHLFYCI